MTLSSPHHLITLHTHPPTPGVGWLDDRHTAKGAPEAGMVVCKIGGPAYRIGMGGGAASSRVQGANEADALLDFDAVQRGDAEMENRMNRVIRACIELGDKNPIVSIHDQGAGGNGNVLKEIVDPHGARYELRKIPVGDPTLSALEIWGAEYQENCAFLVAPGEK
jgi:phosphoribosylformylglycinamidine synthase